MPLKKRTPGKNEERFGERLARIRKAKGFTQAELAEAVGLSQRMITYYESEATGMPPGDYILAFAKAMGVSVDELVGHKKIKEKMTTNNVRLWRKLKQVETLSPKDQRAVLYFIEALRTKQKTSK